MTASEPLPALPQERPRANPAKTRRFATIRTITALMLREMTSRYGRSPGGYIWALLEPLGGILILSLAFQLVLRSPSLGTSFILFYSTGYLVFDMFNKLSSVIARSIQYSKSLLAYPSVTWFDAVSARFILNSMTGMMVSFLILGTILMFEETSTALRAGPIFTAVSLSMLLGMGVGSINCVLFGFSPTYKSLWTIMTRPLMLASAVLYIYEDLPSVAKQVLWYNPLVHITGLMRSGFFPMYAPSYVSIVYVLVIGLISTGTGFALLKRYNREILDI